MRPFLADGSRPVSRGPALAGLGMGAVFVATALAVLAPHRGRAEAAIRADESPCVVEVEPRTEPRILLLGEAPTVTLHVLAYCPGEVMPLHVSLVVDTSQRMAGDRLRRMQDGVIDLVKRLDLDDNPNTRVGVVGFDSTAREVVGLTNSDGRLVSAVRGLEASGGTAIDAGLDAGRAQLVAARRPVVQEDEVLVLFSQGTNDGGCGPARAAASKVHREGMLLATVCVSPGCDARCMRSIASSPRYAFQIEHIEDVMAMFDRMRRGSRNIVIERMTIEDRLASGVRYVAASAHPTPTLQAPDGSALAWRTNYVPSDGITVSYRARPLAPGDQAMSLGAKLHFLDTFDRVGDRDISIPHAYVLEPEIVPTPVR